MKFGYKYDTWQWYSYLPIELEGRINAQPRVELNKTVSGFNKAVLNYVHVIWINSN